MKIQLISLILLLVGTVATSATEPDLQQVLSKIHKASVAKFEVEKKTKSELLGKETVAPGVIYVSANKFRWDTDGDEKSKIIYDGQNIWTVQEPPKGFKAPPQITKMKLDKKTESQVFLNSLFQENFNKQFAVTKKVKTDNNWEFYLKPKQKSLGVEELIIKVNAKSEIKQISYVDEIQNKIVVEINKTTLSSKQNSKLFKYNPPTGVQVNEL